MNVRLQYDLEFLAGIYYDDCLQLAHYTRMLQACGLHPGDDRPIGAILGTSLVSLLDGVPERVFVWFDPGLHIVLGQAVVEDEGRRTGRREVAILGVLHALLEFDALDEVGHQEIEVEIAAHVRVRPAIDRHAIDEAGEVGAVVQVEAAQEVLIGLPA